MLLCCLTLKLCVLLKRCVNIIERFFLPYLYYTFSVSKSPKVAWVEYI